MCARFFLSAQEWFVSVCVLQDVCIRSSVCSHLREVEHSEECSVQDEEVCLHENEYCSFIFIHTFFDVDQTIFKTFSTL